jgi:hypothetical protein
MRYRRGLVLVIALVAAVIAFANLMHHEPLPARGAAMRTVELEPYAAPAVELPRVALALSVDQAYRAIPHQRTPYRRAEASVGAGRIDYLEALFALTDMAMIERVQTQLWLQSDGRHGADRGNHPQILASLDRLRPPVELDQAHMLIREAVAEQAKLFGRWRETRRTDYFDAADPLVRSSHGKLIAAYNELMARYPNEGPQNKQAFFDHLCALDFI